MYVASNITSLNHKPIEYITEIKAIKNITYAYWKLCIDRTPEVVKVNKVRLVVIGQGEGDTR